jgi:hypothetical protein
MKRNLLSLLALTFSLALAQGQFQGPSPELRAKLEPYFNLMGTVGLVLELEKSSDLPLSPEQAQLLLPILNELASSAGYTPEHASELLDTVELEILSPEQLIWIDSEFLKRQEAAQNGERGGFFGGSPPGQAGAPPQGQDRNGSQGRPGGPGDPGGFFQKIMAGESVNMFSDNENAKALLDELITLVSAKAN